VAFEEGTSVDRYCIEALIGSGGMGRVFRAFDPRLGRRVALKVLSAPEQGGVAAKDAAARMMREARAAAAFNHPNVVAIYDVGEVDGAPFIAMELVEGASLRAYVADVNVPLAAKIGWLLDVARALGAAHRAGLVHRDVKPENVLITPEGIAKVLDFGVARYADVLPAGPNAFATTPTQAAITGEGVVIGTPQYMAPEQLRMEPLDGRCDEFAWGVMAFELLSGRLPWKATGGPQLVAALLDPHPPRLTDVALQVPARMAAAVDQALQGARNARFGSMDELVAFVTVASHPILVPSSKDVLAAPTEPWAATEVAGPAARPAQRRRRPVLASVAFGGALVVAGATAAGIAVVRRSARNHEQAPVASASAEVKLPAGAAARAAYQAALQSYRDGRSEAWRHNLEDVVRLDPGFGAAYLWLAHLWLGDDDPRARSYYARASQYRASMGEIDAEVLEALEPRFRDPPDRAERLVRMERLGARHPRDVTAQYMLGLAYLSVHRYEEATAAFDRALAVEPAFAFSYQNEIFVAQYQGDNERARSLADRCLSACPSASDCALKRIELDSIRGDCRAMAADGRATLAMDPDQSIAHELLASAMAALGEPREGVAEMLKRANESETESPDYYGHRRGVALNVLYGDFPAALRESRAAEATLAGRPDRSPVDTEIERLGILAEVGDRPALRSLAASLRARIGAWAGSSDSAETMVVSGYERRAGLISHEELRGRREAWMRARAETHERDGSRRPAYLDWQIAYAGTVEGRDDALEALEALGRTGPMPRIATADVQSSADLGHAYALAERFADALAPLRFATHACNALQWARGHTQALYDLGVSLGATGDVAGAGTAYDTVLARWGSARPRSVTADAAQKRRKPLGN